ncbi:MAG: hypothetical protein ACI4N3_01530 [Alphaproteobacteria bacterium]
MTNFLTYILILLFSFTSSVNACYIQHHDKDTHDIYLNDLYINGNTEKGLGVFGHEVGHAIYGSNEDFAKYLGNNFIGAYTDSLWINGKDTSLGNWSVDNNSSYVIGNTIDWSRVENRDNIPPLVIGAVKLGMWAWTAYTAGKSAQNLGSNIASLKTGPDSNGMYYTENGKVNKNQLMYSTAKNGLGLVSSGFTVGGSNLVSGIGYTSMGLTGFAEDGYMLYQGKNEYGYYENFSGQYMNNSDMTWDMAGNTVNMSIGVYGLYSSMKTNVASNKNMTTMEEVGAKSGNSGINSKKIDKIANDIEEFLGNNVKVIKNKSGDTVFMSQEVILLKRLDLI